MVWKEVDLLGEAHCDDATLMQIETERLVSLSVGISGAYVGSSCDGSAKYFLSSRVSDRGLEKLIDANHAWLQRVQLPGLVRMTKRIPEMLFSSTKLEELDLSECCGVDLRDSLPNCEPCVPNLKVLKLKYVAVSDRFLFSVASHCHNLQERLPPSDSERFPHHSLLPPHSSVQITRPPPPTPSPEFREAERPEGPPPAALSEQGIGAVLCANRNLIKVELSGCPTRLRGCHFQNSLQARACVEIPPEERAARCIPPFFQVLETLSLGDTDDEALSVLARLTGSLRSISCRFGARIVLSQDGSTGGEAHSPRGDAARPTERSEAERGVVFHPAGPWTSGFLEYASTDPADQGLTVGLYGFQNGSAERGWCELLEANRGRLTGLAAPRLCSLAALEAALRCPLQELDLTGAPVVGDLQALGNVGGGVLARVAGGATGLVGLSLTGCDLRSFDLEFSQLRALHASLGAMPPHLPQRRLAVLPGVPEAGAAFAGLEALRLDGNGDIGVEACRDLLWRVGTGRIRLRELRLRGSLPQGGEGGGGGLRLLDGLTSVLSSLRVLDLSDNPLRAPDLLRLPGLLPGVEELALGLGAAGARGEYTEVDTTALLHALETHCPRLARLRCRRMPPTPGDSLALASLLRARGAGMLELELEGLNFGARGNAFEGGALAAAAGSCGRLERVDLRLLHCAGCDEALCKELSRRLPRCSVRSPAGCPYRAGQSLWFREDDAAGAQAGAEGEEEWLESPLPRGRLRAEGVAGALRTSILRLRFAAPPTPRETLT